MSLRYNHFNHFDLFNNTSRYIDVSADVFNINKYDVEASFPYLFPTISNELLLLNYTINVSITILHSSPTLIYPYYGAYVSQLVRVFKPCINVNDFHDRNLNITGKLLRFRYHYLRRTFSNDQYVHLLENYHY